MSKSKEQKEQDLQELTDKLKTAKGVVFADYRGNFCKRFDQIQERSDCGKSFR